MIGVSLFSQRVNGQKSHRKRVANSLRIQQLEDRSVPSTFSVVNLQNSGPGSLRQALLSANANPGADVIDFNVAGTIRLTSGALPAITGAVDIDGTTAPGFAGSPVVAVDFNHFGGLRFAAGSAGSDLRSLGLVNAAAAGVSISGAGDMLIAGNFIGLGLDGTTVAGNRGDGLSLTASSGDTIGGSTVQDRNVISGNRGNGIRLTSSSNNQILGNFVGTDATGMLDRGNVGNGILVTGNSKGNTIGGMPGNVISGNDANGVLITGGATQNTVSGNLVGLAASGTAALGNHLDGVRVENANGNLIGHSDPVTGVTFANTDNVGMQPVSGWQGIRNSDTSGQYLIAGTSDANGLLFDGTMDGVGTSYSVNYPSADTTSVYGPDNLGDSTVRLVGSYKNADFATAPVEVNGFLFEGTTADLDQAGDYQTVDYPGAKFNYVHSTMGGLAVGNYDSPADHGSLDLPLGPGHAYIYDVAQSTFLTDVVYPGSKSNTAYGIWYNGGTSYTICGGYSLDATENFADQSKPIGQAYLVDFDSATGKFTNWATFSYPGGTNFVTHFEGISSVEKGVYTLSADSVQSGTNDPVQGSWVSVSRNSDGSFGKAAWVNLNYTGVDPSTNVTSSNAVYGNQVVGIVIGANPFSYQATVNLGFQLSNVISGNGGNGIGLYAANDNQIAMNYIGTDVTGTVDLGNGKNGIWITAGAKRNLIGGEATGGNDPTNGIFARPPEGNLISGNDANGVLITGNATLNTLNGNFIGTDQAGTAALGNALDGVAIHNASGNALDGCALRTNPFVYYNVISGNGGNGLRVTNSNNTTIQGNFFGLGADNQTPVGNQFNGVVVEGSSANTVMGGPIPLGNVDAANLANGVLVQGTASKFVSYNTFCGLAAFQTYTNLGNGLDGMKITSTGGNILLRTNVITENGADGIEISGSARGVRVAGNIIGLDTNGNAAMGNKGNGVEVDGIAHDIVIGGPQETFNIIPHNAISANGGNGVAIDGKAHNIQVSFSFIGTDLVGTAAFGNSLAGVYVGSGTHSIAIGSTDPTLFSVISGNGGDGIEMNGTRGDTVVGCLIGTDVLGLAPLPNGGDGVSITNSTNNVIGGRGPAAGGPVNLIAFNGGNGVTVSSGNGNMVSANSIFGNTMLGIDLATGANSSAPTPVLTSVNLLPLAIQVSGTLTAKANAAYTIEFFVSDANDASGRYALGSMTVKTNASGVATFEYTGSLPHDGAHFVTATATDTLGNTSEFSLAVA